MKVDVSEIKSFKGCKRQWQLTSRNKFNLRPVVTPSHFALGTIFHEALHQMYLGVPLEKVMTFVKSEMSPKDDVALLAMIPGYYKNVIPYDLDRYKVLDIEHHFNFVPRDLETDKILNPDIEVCGSIDMIVLDELENAIYGFEHKTCKNFRDESFMWMDEQPRVYTYALKLYIEDYNRKHPEAKPATLGGIYINEVKKLLRDFQYHRTLCTYPEEDMVNFMRAFFMTCCACHDTVVNNEEVYPSPSYFNCSLCDYKSICSTYMYASLNRGDIVREFGDEYKINDVDHLDEKVERSIE